MIGCNVDPLNLSGRPEPALLRSIGFDSVRLVLRPGVEAYCRDCRDAGISVLGVVARESEEPAQYAGWPLDIVQVGNEMDVRGAESSWYMSPADYYALWTWCEEVFAPTPLIIGGMASGNVYRAEEYTAVESAIALGVHPYGKDVSAARALLHSYRDVCGIPVMVSEWNRPAEEIAGFLRMLEEETTGSWWFAWSNGMVPGFGLDEPGKLAAMKEGIMTLATEAAAVESRVASLEDRMKAEERRNAWLVEWLAHYGLDDPEIKQLARTIADAASPGILDGVNLLPPPPGQ